MRQRRRVRGALSALILVVPLLAAILATASPAVAATIDQVTLAKGVGEVGEPMTLAVLPDRSVLHTSRGGTLYLTDAAGNTKVSGTLSVYGHDEEGLQGIGVDPNFSSNRAIYLYYAPPLSTPGGDAPENSGDPTAYNGVNRLSRFTLNADGTLNAGSEQALLDVPANRGICCHVGGDIDFDAAGNLYLTTGDDTNPFQSDGYSPIDERTSRNPAFDAQRSAGNTNDLRGKVLRIKVDANGGGYTIPSGNLFAQGTANTRAEIYAMGFRNPFRMSVDKATGIVYLGDYGPDAGGPSSTRGPGGQVEFNRITSPGNYGWPYCTGNNSAYNDYDFASGASGGKFDCAGGPTNNSPHNTGLTKLPPARPAWIPYGGDDGSPPEFGGGSESPMGGPVYHYDAGLASDTKLPADYDGAFFAGEFGRGWIKPIKQDANGNVTSIGNFAWNGKQVMDMAIGPDGALYVLDYGTGYFNGDENSALYRFDYNSGANRAPTAAASASPTSGGAPLTVSFSSVGSSDPDGDALSYAWDFDNNGSTDSTSANPSHTYTGNGTYTAKLTVSDPGGKSGSANVTINVGNTAPSVTITQPANGQIFHFGDKVHFKVTVTDPEDGSIDCSKVKFDYILGHDSHGHPITTAYGCEGDVQTTVDGEHDVNANTFGVWNASYTDSSGLTGSAQNITQPATRQAEHFNDPAGSGTQVVDHTNAHGGKTVGYIDNGDSVALSPYNLTGIASFTARIASGGSGGTLELRANSATGTLIGSATVPSTGGWENFQDVTGTVTNPGGTVKLFLVFKGSGSGLFDVDDVTFTAGGGGGGGGGGGAGPITGIGGKCVDISGSNTADGTKVQLWTCNGTGAQTWTVNGDGSITALGKCLDVAGGGTANGTKAQLWTCNGTGAQKWQYQAANQYLVNPQSGRCLDAEGVSSADGTQLHIWDCVNGANQKWTLP